MAARALAAAAAARRMAGHTGGSPLLASSRRGGAQSLNHSSSAQAQLEEQKSIHDGVAGEQVEAALNRKNVEVLPDEMVDALEGGPEDAWVPDQETGVFAPADEAVSCTESLSHGAAAGGSSVLDQSVFVREEEMEDVERPAIDMATANRKAK
uniref:Uncharacterized protein n=1 Tax=Oryza brachyantha TaxID=4533 RepID=J3MAR2_ORYBR